MNNTALTVLVRQIIVRSLYLAPFWLAFVYIPSPFNILAACLLTIKHKQPSEIQLYEMQVLAKHTVMILARSGTDEDRVNLARMKKAFVFGDEVLHDADIDGSSAKFLVDTLFLVIEGLSIAVMVVFYAVAKTGI